MPTYARARTQPGPPERSHTLVIGLLAGAVLLLGVVAVVGLVVAIRSSARPPANPSVPAQNGKQPKTELSTEQIVARSDQSVAMVRGNNSVGTGFVASPGLLVTNAHVIRSEFIGNLAVHFPSADESQRGPYLPKLIFQDLARDIAVLSLPSRHPSLPLGQAYRFRRGQDVTVIGNPGVGSKMVLQNAVSKGVMSTETIINGHKFYQLSISINPGNSGGPVFDSNGKVIGVVTLKAREEEGLAFCIPLDDVLKALAKAERLSPDEIQANHSQHRAVAIFLRLRAAGKIMADSLTTYVSAMQLAVANGLEPSDGIEAAREKLKDTYGDLDVENFVRNVPAALNKLRGDAKVSPSVKKRLATLWTNYTQMKGYVDNPRGTVQAFGRTTERLTARYGKLTETLANELGIPEGGR